MSVTLLKIVAFLDLLGVGLLIPVLSGHVRDLGGTHITVGLLQSVYAGCQMISGPIVGSLSDIKGRKKILFWTLLLCSPMYLVIGLSKNVYMILLARGALGIFKQTQTLARALVPDYDEQQELSAVYGEMSAYTGAGVTIGPLIGGHVMERDPHNGFIMLSVMVSILFLFNSALIYSMAPPPKRLLKKKRRHLHNRGNVVEIAIYSIKQSIINLISIDWSQYWDIFLMKGLIGFTMSNYYANYTLYLRSIFRLNPKQVGYVISFQAIVGSISSYFMGYINKLYPDDTDYSERVTHIFLMITFALIGLSVSWNIQLYTLFLIPLAAGNSMGRCISLEMILSRCRGLNRAALIGVSNSVRSLAGVIAPMNAGYLASYFGVQYVIYASLVTAFFGTFLSFCQSSSNKW